MPDSVLQMAPWGQPMATGKAHVLLSGPWVTMSEPQLYLPPMPCQALRGEMVQKSGQVRTRGVQSWLREACG